MADFNFDQGPQKVFVEGFWGQRFGGQTHLMLQSGGEKQVFVIDAVLAKKIAKLLLQHVEVIEKEIGHVLDDRLDNEPMPTPLDVGDIKKK